MKCDICRAYVVDGNCWRFLFLNNSCHSHLWIRNPDCFVISLLFFEVVFHVELIAGEVVVRLVAGVAVVVAGVAVVVDGVDSRGRVVRVEGEGIVDGGRRGFLFLILLKAPIYVVVVVDLVVIDTLGVNNHLGVDEVNIYVDKNNVS